MQAIKAVFCSFAQVSYFIHFRDCHNKENYHMYLKTFILYFIFIKRVVMLKVLELVPGKMHLDFDLRGTYKRIRRLHVPLRRNIL